MLLNTAHRTLNTMIYLIITLTKVKQKSAGSGIHKPVLFESQWSTGYFQPYELLRKRTSFKIRIQASF